MEARVENLIEAIHASKRWSPFSMRKTRVDGGQETFSDNFLAPSKKLLRLLGNLL